MSCFGEEDGVLVVTYNSNDRVNEGRGNPELVFQCPTWVLLSAGVATNLPAGTCSVTITDVEGCQDSLSYTLMEPTAIMATIPDPEDPPCFNSTTKVNIDTVFGAPALLRRLPVYGGWQRHIAAIDVPATSLVMAPHVVEIFDLNGCSAISR